VNKWDINPSTTETIEKAVEGLGVKPLGRIRYDAAVTRAQVQGKSLVEFSDNGAAADVRGLWENVLSVLDDGE
jgi:MinD superfamily P-loop ATPase